MILRCIELEDKEKLEQIHDKHFKNEFEFPDFYNGYLSSFVVTSDDGRIITGGGIRPIIEAVIITDKDVEIEQRRQALMHILRMSVYGTANKNYHELHAFVQDEDWLRHLKKAGFQETKGKSLVLSF